MITRGIPSEGANRGSEERSTEKISRQWTGVAKPGKADSYIRHLREETFPSLAKIAGFIEGSILRRDTADGTEFRIVTVWESRDAIAGFAGPQIDVAVIPDVAHAMLVRYDERAVHYEIVNTDERSPD